ncbi:MAG TPA: hypothetical protein VJX10_16175 [Pseudonocardiaceae bacterium]|nr:hypothetical protein [Pseudonocardiaceae bacterium]
MDTSELTALASVAAGQMIQLMATDGWAAAKSSFVSLWRRLHPERVDADLTRARSDLLAARQTGDDELEKSLVAEWQARLARLLVAQPEVVDELRRLLNPAAGGQQTVGSMRLDTRVTGGGDAYVAGRDQTINRR